MGPCGAEGMTQCLLFSHLVIFTCGLRQSADELISFFSFVLLGEAVGFKHNMSRPDRRKTLSGEIP